MRKRHCAALVVGTDDWAADQAAGALRREGITVLQCHDSGAPAFPCNAFIEGRVCPLDEGVDVAITVRTRSSRVVAPGEVGAVCALRAGLPLVVSGVNADNPFASVATKTVEQGGDTVRACLEVAEHGGAEKPIDLRSTAST